MYLTQRWIIATISGASDRYAVVLALFRGVVAARGRRHCQKWEETGVRPACKSSADDAAHGPNLLTIFALFSTQSGSGVLEEIPNSKR